VYLLLLIFKAERKGELSGMLLNTKRIRSN
jgi:hypothetical protein